MAGIFKRLAGPVALTNTYTTNVYNQSASSVYDIVRQIHVVNKTAGAVTFRLYVGATGANTAGTELFFDYSVPANSTYDWYGLMLMASTDFLVGGASASTSLTITVMGDRYAT